MAFSLADLDNRLAERAKASPEDSYTAKLLRDGVDRCARKFGEEAFVSFVVAVARVLVGVAYEAADVLFLLLVLLRVADVPLSAVLAELERRTSQSGLEEKASRTR